MKFLQKGVLDVANSARSVYQRIRSVKSSLENAEQSFLENNGMRGELDLMLAEAELKNLRCKKDVPWSWNRQLLAVCSAAMLALAGLGGWYYAQGSVMEAAPHNEAASSAPLTVAEVRREVPVQPQAQQKTVNSAARNEDVQIQSKAAVINNRQKAAAQENARQDNQVTISRDDMRRLVQSARVELSNSK